MDDPIEAVLEMMDRRAAEASKRLAMTAVASKVFDALDYALQERVMVRIEGDSRFGKTEAIRAWADMRPGLARVVNVPPTNTLGEMVWEVAQALGIEARYRGRAEILRERVRFVLKQSRLFLILDEAHWLIPQIYTKTTAPQRLDWIRSETVNNGLPLALIHTPQTFLKDADKFVTKTGFAKEQFFGRIHRIVQLPNDLPRADLIAVARIHFPEVSDGQLEVVADLAEISENYLQTVEAVSKLARYIARREGHRRITVSDIETAAHEVLPRRAGPADDHSLDTIRRPGASRTPARSNARALMAPLKAGARALQASRMQPAGEESQPRFSLRGARPEKAETDLIPAGA